MLVGSRMVHPVITVGIKTEVTEAEKIFEKANIKTIPVTDRQGRFMGLLVRDELEKKRGSGFDFSGVLAEEVMDRKVLTIPDSFPIEEAVRIFNDYRVLSLPVLHDGYVVGIITLSCLLNVFLEATGARTKGVRLTVQLLDGNAELLRLLEVIAKVGANIGSLTTYSGEDISHKVVALKVDGIDKFSLKQAVKPWVDNIIDISGD